ncbi:DUF1893 domain-containing protein [Patescibacteria group bacterium]|nr:DUF1893 domain-containing protein [Patescibacteria group bacterium]MBU0964649.1 DUF1893 domain-containing protein [Patescibacteria group bacterium]
MYSLAKFKKSPWSLIVYQGNCVIFRSKASSLLPLIRFLDKISVKGKKHIFYDKYVGRAAALLMIIAKPAEINTPIISSNAIKLLKSKGICVNYSKEVKYLMGFASDEMCKWEKLSFGTSSDNFYKLVKSRKVR